MTVQERFWRRVRKGPAHLCWDWTGCKWPGGYGQFTWSAKYGRSQPIGSHRIAWELTHGEIPAGQHVLHACDRRSCCNPAHLFLGTHDDNMKDAALKGRLHVPRPGRHKLTPEQIEDVRRQVATGPRGTANQLARALGVTKGHISQIVSGKRRQYDAPLLAAQEQAS